MQETMQETVQETVQEAVQEMERKCCRSGLVQEIWSFHLFYNGRSHLEPILAALIVCGAGGPRYIGNSTGETCV